MPVCVDQTMLCRTGSFRAIHLLQSVVLVLPSAQQLLYLALCPFADLQRQDKGALSMLLLMEHVSQDLCMQLVLQLLHQASLCCASGSTAVS